MFFSFLSFWCNPSSWDCGGEGKPIWDKKQSRTGESPRACIWLSTSLSRLVSPLVLVTGTSYLICRAQCKMKIWGPILKNYEFQDDYSRALNQGQVPSEHGALVFLPESASSAIDQFPGKPTPKARDMHVEGLSRSALKYTSIRGSGEQDRAREEAELPCSWGRDWIPWSWDCP